jgi:hypothetical protein
MAKKINEELTACAIAGFEGTSRNTHLFSSPCHIAHAFGEYMKATGREKPADVRMGRGYKIRCRDLVFKVTWPQRKAIAFEREQ